MSSYSDADSFIRLLEPCRDALYRFAARSLWRKSHVNDVLQEAVMTAWSQFDRFERGTNFRAWMFTILLNTVYRVNRKIHRSREVALDSDVFDPEHLIEKETAWLSVLEDPDRVMQSLDDRLVAALDRLSTTERACFLLRLLEDFSYKEIAEQLDLPMGTVMSHVYRARMKLRERLADLAIEEGLVRSTSEDSQE